jgi:hypothetical protein
MKSIWTILKETLIGFNNEGSAKRATAAYVTAIILTAITAVYCIAFLKASEAYTPTSVQVAIVEMFCAVLYSWQLCLYILFGLATFETITNLVKLWRGQSIQENTTNQTTNQ